LVIMAGAHIIVTVITVMEEHPGILLFGIAGVLLDYAIVHTKIKFLPFFQPSNQRKREYYRSTIYAEDDYFFNPALGVDLKFYFKFS